jgi:hypothetical protein
VRAFGVQQLAPEDPHRKGAEAVQRADQQIVRLDLAAALAVGGGPRVGEAEGEGLFLALQADRPLLAVRHEDLDRQSLDLDGLAGRVLDEQELRIVPGEERVEPVVADAEAPAAAGESAA